MKNLLGVSPLIVASDRGHVGIVNALLAHGANPSSADNKEAAALMKAV
jgi:ankyrin repeat protein